MKKTTSKFLIPALLAMTVLSAGCASLEEHLVKPDYATTINGPLTAVEYTNKVDRTILPFMGEGETFLAHALEVRKGTFPAEQEIALVDASLDKAQSAIEMIDALYPPEAYAEHKTQAILRLTEYKDSLIRYRDALEGGKSEDVSLTADGIKSMLASLKLSYSVYQK